MLLSMESILLIISVTLVLLSLGYSIFYLVKFVKNKREKDFDKKRILNLLIPIIIASLFMVGINLGRKILHNWDMDALHIVLTILGSLLFASNVLLLIDTFILRYYKKSPELGENIRKWNSRLLFISIPTIVISFFVMMEGIGPYIQYPLTNGVTLFTVDGFAYLTRFGDLGPDSALGDFKLHIAWYGIVIVVGAVIAYFISDHRMYKIYKKHGLLDTCFLIAFPMGIIGARLWYCLVLKPDYYLADPVQILRIMDGGLAIQGGALLGIISGVTYMMVFKRFVNIRDAIDMVVPTILIAQALGRWGNFFNHEVYGAIVNKVDWWFIPTFIKEQMFVEGEPTKMFVPLFFIESLINIAGYFIITKFVGEFLKKYWKYPKGTLASLYLVWYGIVRLVMEPLRYGANEEVDKFQQSWITAIVFVILGLLLIGFFYLLDLVIIPKIKANKKQK